MLLSPRMVSLRQLESNRRNARRSTGPRSPSGKLKSARNAFKHGLTALLFTQETNHSHPPEEIEQAIAAAYRPQTPEEHQLIHQMVQGHIRAQLCRHQLQQSFFALKRGQKEFDGPRGQCGTTLGQLESMRLIMRYPHRPRTFRRARQPTLLRPTPGEDQCENQRNSKKAIADWVRFAKRTAQASPTRQTGPLKPRQTTEISHKFAETAPNAASPPPVTLYLCPPRRRPTDPPPPPPPQTAPETPPHSHAETRSSAAWHNSGSPVV